MSMNIPKEFVYNLRSFSGTKTEFTVPQVGSSSVTPNNNEIRFRLLRHRGTNMCLDGSQLRLSFDSTVSGGTGPAFSNVISSIISRYQVLVNSRIVDEIQSEAGLWHVVEYNLIHDTDYNTTVGIISEGVDTKANREGYAPLYHYVVELRREGFLDRVLPSYKMGEIELVIRLNSSSGEISENDDNATTSVSLNNPQLFLTYIDSANLRSYFDSQDVTDNYIGITHYATEIPASATQATLTIPVNKFNNLKSILHVMRDQTDAGGLTLADPQRLDKYESYLNTVNEYYWKINNIAVPRDRVDNTNTSESLKNLVHYIKAMWGIDPINSEWLDVNFRTGSKFIACYDFSAHHNVISGLNTKSNNADINFVISSKTAHPRLTQLDTYVGYDVVFKITRNGSLQLSF